MGNVKTAAVTEERPPATGTQTRRRVTWQRQTDDLPIAHDENSQKHNAIADDETEQRANDQNYDSDTPDGIAVSDTFSSVRAVI